MWASISCVLHFLRAAFLACCISCVLYHARVVCRVMPKMEKKIEKNFIAIILVLIPALFVAGCIAQPQQKATPTPTPRQTVAPVTCTQDVYASCPDGFQYLKAKCANGELKDVLYLVDPCLNHQLPTPIPTEQPPIPTEQPSPTITPLPSILPTTTPSPAGCTQNVTGVCPNGREYLDSICENGVLIKINYFADPCGVSPSPTPCSSDSYATCPNGKTYLSASCVDGVLYPISYFRDPCA